MKCMICDKEIKYNEERVLFGLDGDFIHKACESKKEKFFSAINNMTDSEFNSWMRGAELKI